MLKWALISAETAEVSDSLFLGLAMIRRVDRRQILLQIVSQIYQPYFALH
jgi:hypothetical protein